MSGATRRSLLIAVLLAAAPTTAGAFWIGEFCDHVRSGARRNRQWPSPHICADRQHVRSPFQGMVNNGWRRQNLLGGHHFNEDATQLTQSGKLKVQWIMTQAPPEFRRVFVERSLDEGVTDQRITTATDFASLVAQGETVPQVAETHLVSEGRPAATVDFVNTQFRENMPKPTLPQATQSSSSAQ